jgi:hypothetical protein
MEEVKVCKKCNLEKYVSEFRNSRNSCKECERKISLLYHYQNKKRLAKYTQEWKQKNKDHVSKYNREYHKEDYRENKEERLNSMRIYRENNKDRIKKSREKYQYKNRERLNEQRKIHRKLYPVKHMLIAARKRAKKQDIIFDLNECDITIPKVCPILGIILETGEGHPNDNSPSLDKIIPKLGYIPGNVSVISNRANMIKSDATFEEIERLYLWMTSQRQK